MKNFILIFAFAMSVIACDGSNSSGQELYAYNGTWTFTGKFCDDVVGSYRCVEILEPAACAAENLFAAMTIDYHGENIIIDSVASPMTHAGNDITVTNTAETFNVRVSPTLNSMLITFATGCELQFSRR